MSGRRLSVVTLAGVALLTVGLVAAAAAPKKGGPSAAASVDETVTLTANAASGFESPWATVTVGAVAAAYQAIQITAADTDGEPVGWRLLVEHSLDGIRWQILFSPDGPLDTAELQETTGITLHQRRYRLQIIDLTTGTVYSGPGAPTVTAAVRLITG